MCTRHGHVGTTFKEILSPRSRLNDIKMNYGSLPTPAGSWDLGLGWVSPL
jgi:hypothetical protein